MSSERISRADAQRRADRIRAFAKELEQLEARPETRELKSYVHGWSNLHARSRVRASKSTHP
jgi:hypothetical protein